MTLNAENNNKLSELLCKGFERTVAWNEYKSKIETVNVAVNDNNFKRTTLDVSFQGVSRLFAQEICLLDYDYHLKDFNIAGIDLSHPSCT